MKIFLIGDCWEGCLKIKKNLFLCFRQAQGKLEIFGRGSFKIENIYFFVSDKLKEDWRLLGGMSQNKKYLFLCFRQAQGRLEIVGRGCLKIYSANEDDTGTYTCRAENLLDSVDSDASLVVLGKY
jgi:hypothetical protein